MAVRHLIAFKPYDGQTVCGARVDVGAVLIEARKGRDAMVRDEVPYHLAEAGVAERKGG